MPWVPEGVDVEVPNAARMYDYILEGSHNFAADRQLAEKVLKVVPAEEAARSNRAFLRRTVRHLVRDVGVRQFRTSVLAYPQSAACTR
ncbi:SAM-dependent methyltransferase [Actinocrispum wychmicini]|uniref:S-adenosyl methyltransferase n=1 Tax=Actinocrispum wychmicini TaxID=1213861 RepID=A0A4R2K7M9_9PSEU|nr:SAM-dependent methyltransferase [Actinocrispum wychmicini]TCO65959.1 S-adenosyl methyltransferase [Actinocrispum wychmicini]